jgi:hypothetical protein
MNFRKRPSGPHLSRDQAERQGKVSSQAFLALGQADAIAFLNTHDDGLGGRPIDLAVNSAEGLAAVERALQDRKAAAE